MHMTKTESADSVIKPVLKWAGGKRQLLPELSKRLPPTFNQYIEPFFGGGALFFHLKPKNAVVADANDELINFYQVVANSPQALINAMKQHHNDADYFYVQRGIDRHGLSAVEAAARTLFLNKTCFNGLYRVNRRGEFNVPFANYANPTLCDSQALHSAANLLRHARILCDDYRQILIDHANANDVVFLDPPYHPVSKYSDFKRYTKTQFGEAEHIELARQVNELKDKGCHVVLTNSNSELVLDLYSQHTLDVIDSKRNINSNASKRRAKDVIVTVTPKRVFRVSSGENQYNNAETQLNKFPPTRFMGSKRKLLAPIREAVLAKPCESVLDLFAGSGVVSYMLKTHNKNVICNDYMAFSASLGKALIENNQETLDASKAQLLFEPNADTDRFVETTFQGLYFSHSDNQLIDTLRANIKCIDNEYQRAIATSALVRACFKKRPRGIFTYVGHRYDDGRKDLITPLSEHFLLAVDAINAAVFDNGHNNIASRQDALNTAYKPDVVYIDPPYYSAHSDNDYVRRYHFVEGIACDWQGVEMQWNTKTRKFKKYPTPFSSAKGTYAAFDKLFALYKNSRLIVSYSSNSKPELNEMIALLKKYKNKVDVTSIDHRYSFGNQHHKIDNNKNSVSEYVFVAD